MAPIMFSGLELDRAAERRADAEWVAAARADPRGQAIVAGRRGIAVDGQPPAAGTGWEEVAGEPLLKPLRVPVGERAPILLGVTDAGAPLWAVEAVEGEELVDLRHAAVHLSPGDAGLFAYAAQLIHWRAANRFCGRCGQATEPREAGHVLACPRGHLVHPRTDPVVIMLVTDGFERVLMGRQPAWPAGRYSALAGFVEPGESLEAAVAREVLEEAGVAVSDVRYHSSQPWPFPGNLMLGFFAAYAGGAIASKDAELEDVRWFTRSEIEAAATGEGDYLLPPSMAIARTLLDSWLAGGRGA